MGSRGRMKKALDGETPREDMLRLIYDQIEKTHKVRRRCYSPARGSTSRCRQAATVTCGCRALQIGGSYVGSQSGYTGSVELRARAPVSSYSESQSGSVTGDGRVSGVNRRSDPGRASGASSRLKLTKSRADNENRWPARNLPTRSPARPGHRESIARTGGARALTPLWAGCTTRCRARWAS